MNNQGVGVIATTLSGSIADWRKVERILPLFREHGREDVTLHVVGTHAEARRQACVLVEAGVGTLISAGGSGTFNSVLEGCLDAGVDPGATTLGFLRKGSADLIGKTLGMPDSIEKAIEVFAESMAINRTVRCDVIEVLGDTPGAVPPAFRGLWRCGAFRADPPLHREPVYQVLQGNLKPAVWRSGSVLGRDRACRDRVCFSPDAGKKTPVANLRG